MVEQLSRYGLSNRYHFTGRLVMQTAFHIGGGKATLSNSDSPVVLTPEGAPYIPGSSFKGALRSTVEKLVGGLPNELGLWSCGLDDLNTEEAKEAKAKNHLCPTVNQSEVNKQRRDNPEKWSTAEIIKDLCNTCHLFGSPFAAARLNINDLYVIEGEWSDVIERRDGVAIDRDSEKAKDRKKYDFEVVPASTEFQLKMTLENALPQDLQLMSIGLSEFMHGFGFIGGKRSRGLGGCLLDEVVVESLDLTKNNEEYGSKSQQLRNYLLDKKFPRIVTGKEFLEEQIKTLFPDEK